MNFNFVFYFQIKTLNVIFYVLTIFMSILFKMVCHMTRLYILNVFYNHLKKNKTQNSHCTINLFSFNKLYINTYWREESIFKKQKIFNYLFLARNIDQKRLEFRPNFYGIYLLKYKKEYMVWYIDLTQHFLI